LTAFAARSYLFAPGDRPDLMDKAVRAGADAVLFDLEDAVATPAKAESRGLVAAAIRAHRDDAMVMARVNGPGTAEFVADIAAVVAAGVAAVRIPKVESAAQVRGVCAAIAEVETKAGLPVGRVVVECTIETAAGLLAAPAIATADPRVCRLVFGAIGFAADIGAHTGPDESELLMARCAVVVASRAAALPSAVDGAYTAIEDHDGLAVRCRRARALGFGACSAIHPRQVPVINRAFVPDPAEVERARSVLAAFASASDAGRAVATLDDGTFVDAPLVEQARAVLVRAGQP
jgi:citrate lyase subunit beta / citryl-CoA lyase